MTSHSTLTTARKLPVTVSAQGRSTTRARSMSDAQLMKNGSASLSRAGERLVEMQNE